MMRRAAFATLVLSLLAAAEPAPAQTAADSAGIRHAALDYIEGYYEGNGERMERALHPELAKRIVHTNPQGRSQLGQMRAMSLVQGTRNGGGRDTPEAERRKDITIFDIYQNAATAKIHASGWVDYLHLAEWNGRWVIVNVLWEPHPRRE
ncbi:MAG: nuclear transport factor 2 family protein [Gemmatimonadales bacterium]